MINHFHMIRKRLITLGIKPKHAREIALDFDQQVKARGVHGALDYFKAVGDTLIGYLSGSRYAAPWVATCKGGFPKRWVVLMGYPTETLFRVGKMARAILLPHPTPKLVSKLKDAATGPYQGSVEAMIELSRLVNLGVTLYDLQIPEFSYKFKSVCAESRTYKSRSVPTGTKVGLDLNVLLGAFASWMNDIIQFPNWEDAFYPIHPSWVGRNCKKFPSHPHVGELGGVMEQGGKLRIFAAPSVLLQSYLEPLQLWLDKIRLQIPSDMFKCQGNGAIWAQQKMNSGVIIHSIDLSSATCRFPLVPQLALCEKLGAPLGMLSLYEKVCRGSWKSQPQMVDHFGEYVTWTVGQPLGTSPSMSSFALTHNMLLAGLCSELNLDHLDSFRILGDDVVISEDSLAIRYRQIISDLGIGISEHKSYVSQTYGEFAGYSISPDLLVRPGRWRAPSVLNIQGLVKDLGASVIEELHQDARFIEKLIAFHDGLFTPEISEWNHWLKLNSLLFTTNLSQVTLHEKNIPWYDGCCLFLHKEYPGIYFGDSNTPNFLDQIDQDEQVIKSKALLWPSQAIFPQDFRLSTEILTVESFYKDDLPYQELVEKVEVLSDSYEGYLWSIPKTNGRLIRDRHRVIESAYLALSQ